MSAIHKMRGGCSTGAVTIVGTPNFGGWSSTNGSTHTFGNIQLGPACSDKKCIAGATWEDFGIGNKSITSYTVGGVALTQRIRGSASASEDVDAAIFSGDISSLSGIHAISITFNAEVESAAVTVMAVTGLQDLVPTFTGEDQTVSGAQMKLIGLSAPAFGIAIAFAASQNAGATPTWSSLTPRSTRGTGGSGTDHRHMGAWDFGLRSASDELIDMTLGTERAFAGAGFR